MAKKPEAVTVFTVPAAGKQPSGDPFADAFARADQKKTDAQVAFDRKRDELRAELAQIVWRKARGQSTLADAGRLVELADSEHLADLKIDRELFDRLVSICVRWQGKRDQFAAVGMLQEQRDAAHARFRQLEMELRDAESAASAAAGQLLLSHGCDGESRAIARGTPLLFDPILNQPLDGTQQSVEAFVAAATK